MTTGKKPTPRYQPTPRRQPSSQRQRASRNQPAPKRAGEGGGNWLRFVGIGAAGVVAVAIVVGVIAPTVGSLFANDSGKNATTPSVVSFVAVGDNLPDEYIGWFADRQAGEENDGLYDYSPAYKPIQPYIESADLAYVDEETHLGGDDIGPQGYPSFNAMDAMAAAIVDTGFDLVASASNHAYDWGQNALAHSVALWESQPVAFTGTSVTEEQYNRIPVVERNGISFALLNYTYGVNYDLNQLPAHTINLIDDARIASDVARAHDMADVVLVAMHWGTELLTEADDEQHRVAQLLADLDVDVVMGSHPHVIGPMEWVASSKNPDHRTLVTYSLGNFLADHDAPLAENVLEGMMTCDFVRAEAGGPVVVDNVRWVPIVCHSNQNRDDFAIYTLDDYPSELAAQCRALSEVDNPKRWLYEETVRIVGEQWF